MTKLTDETLMYYADGLLSPSECEWVEKLLAEDPDLRSRAQIFRSTGRSLARLLEEADDEPAPQKLRDFVSSLEAARAGATASADEPGGARRKYAAAGRGAFAPGNFGLAFAACAALVAGVGLGWTLRGGGSAGRANVPGELVRIEGNRLIATGPLRRALDAAPSGGKTALALSDGSELPLSIKMTFKNEAQDYCREYEFAAGASERYAAVACRVGGQWSVQFQALLPPAGVTKDGVKPAGGKNPAMDAAVGALIDGDPLAPGDEAAVLSRGWEK